MKCRYLITFALLALGQAFASDRNAVGAEERHAAHRAYHAADEGAANQALPCRRHFTGDWNGRRGWLLDRGISVLGGYVLDAQGNPYGGRRQGFTGASGLYLDAHVDFYRLLGFCGLEGYISACWNNGRSLTEIDIENAFAVQQIFGGQTAQLCQLYLKQRFGRASIKVGRLFASPDFLASPLYFRYVSVVLNSVPVAVPRNVLFNTYPEATWGAVFTYKLSCRLTGKFGVYNANARAGENRFHGLNFTFNSTNGLLLISEGVFHPHPKAMLKVGAFYQTGKATRFLHGPTHGIVGGYVSIDQTIYKRGHRELIPWAVFTMSQPDRSEVPYFVAGGFVLKAPFARRCKDAFAFSAVHALFSRDLRKAQRTGKGGVFGSVPQVYETQLEANYWIQVNSWLELTPVIQYVISHRETDKLPNALVLGFQMTMEL